MAFRVHVRGWAVRRALELVFCVSPFVVASAEAAVPIAPGTIELQAGIAGIVLPEEVHGTFSLQPEIRAGYFVLEAIELQAQAEIRVWPLGDVAPDYYGLGGSVLWFPDFQERSLYVLGGMAGAWTDPPGPEEGGFDPLARAGFGFKVPISGLGPLNGSYLNLEYRGEMVFAETSSFVSGAAIGLSFFPGQEAPPPPPSSVPAVPPTPPTEGLPPPPKIENVPPPELKEVAPPDMEPITPPDVEPITPPDVEPITPPDVEPITPPEE